MAGQTMAKPRGDKAQRYVFYLGLFLALIAAIIVFWVLSSSGGGGGGGTVPVVVANESIPADTKVTSEMLKVEFMSPDDANADAFSSRSQVVDRVVTKDIAAGAPVVPTMVSENAGTRIAFKVEPGMRAIAVTVEEVVTAGGNLTPGDHVDVVGIFEVRDIESANFILHVLGLDYTLVEPPRPAPGPVTQGEEEAVNENNLILTVTMFQNVKLLAIAQSLTETRGGGDLAEEVDQGEPEPRAATATLELDPQNAQEITWANHFGVLRMDARPAGEEEVVDVVPTLFSIERTR